MNLSLPLVAHERGLLGEAGLAKLESLCDVLQVSSLKRRDAIRLFEEISASWADWAVGDAPSWSSDVTDDGTPFEFSVAFENQRCELRMLFESQLRPLTNRSSWDAGIAFGERLRAAGRADLTFFDEVSKLFAPKTLKNARFSLWHAVVLREERCLYKAYFNPELEDPAQGPARVDTALKRLGLEKARKFVKACTALATTTARLPYFSVDLERPECARAKIYLAASSAAHATAIAAETGGLDPAVCADWLKALVGSEAPQQGRPFLICAGFRRGTSDPDVTVHVPIRCFTENDNEAVERAARLLSPSEAVALRSVTKAVSGHSPSSTSGVLTYASLRQTKEGVRLTGYFAPQLYTPLAQASSGTHTVKP
jgi:tryptophan dimethylallyltransferase